MNINLNKMETAFLIYDHDKNTWFVSGELPDHRDLKAEAEDTQTLSVYDISHWTQTDLDEFDSADAGDRAGIIENLDEINDDYDTPDSGYGLVFGMGGWK